jgi:TRAP-type C4-dicarboxylate transport system permease large subunit
MLKIIFLLLMASGLPVAIAMAGSSLIYILVSGNQPALTVVHRMIGGIDSFPLLAVPFFILAGNLMNNAGITNRIYNFALALVGWLKGGLGHVNVVGSVIFAGMSGTAIADAAGLGTIEIKAMKDHGYATEFAVGVTAASATLGPIIPPSLPFVIYAMMANVSVGALFLAGILPGVMMALLMMITVAYFAHKNGWGGDIKFSGSRFGKALIELAVVVGWPLAVWGLVQAGMQPQFTVAVALVVLFAADRYFGFQAVLPIMTPVLLIGGMTTGLFTPTEGAIAACVWSMVLGLAWYRTMRWKMFVKVCLDTVETTATVMFIVAAASIFGWMLTATGVTAQIAAWVLAVTKEPWLFLLMANLLMLFVGCFLEPTAAITILVPILLPIARQLGVDPVHFGLIMVLNLMIGLLHRRWAWCCSCWRAWPAQRRCRTTVALVAGAASWCC